MYGGEKVKKITIQCFTMQNRINFVNVLLWLHDGVLKNKQYSLNDVWTRIPQRSTCDGSKSAEGRSQRCNVASLKVSKMYPLVPTKYLL